MKKMFIIIPILIAAVGFIFLFGVMQKQKKIEDIIICENINEICEIEYTKDTGIGKLIREDNFWYYEGEDIFAADRAMVEEQLEVLSIISPKGIVKRDKKEDAYGLEKPKYSISLKNDNGQEKTIYVGNENEDKDYYIRIDEQKEIYIVSQEIKDVIVRFYSQQRMFERFDAYTSPTR